jgi:hypothetical protein
MAFGAPGRVSEPRSRNFSGPGTLAARRIASNLGLEHFSYCCRAAKGSLNHAFASSVVMSGSSSVMA